MKKKIILLVSVLLCMLAVCSCGQKEDAKEAARNESLQATCEQTAQVLQNLTLEEAAYYQTMYASEEGGEIYAEFMAQWMEIQPQIGEFVGLKNFNITKAGKTISAVQTIAFTERDVKLTYVLNANKNEITAVNVEMVYTLGETMSKAGLNTLMGIGIVFTILILICLIIYCFNIFPIIEKKIKDGKKREETVIVSEAPKEEAVIPQTDDTELIAVIAAAIAAGTGASTDDFVVRSIKRRY